MGHYGLTLALVDVVAMGGPPSPGAGYRLRQS